MRSASRRENSSRIGSATWSGWRRCRPRRCCASPPAAPLHRGVEIGVLEDEEGRVAASSIEVWSTCSAEASISFFPTSVDPVNDSLRSRGSPISGPVALLDERVVITLTTPPGRPASSRIWASASMQSGVCCAGSTTLVQPAAMAGPSLRVPMAMGKFQGVIIRHGPTGCFITSTLLVPLANCL